MDYTIIANPTGQITSEGMKPAKMDPVKITNLKKKFPVPTAQAPSVEPVVETPVSHEPVVAPVEVPVAQPVQEAPVQPAPVATPVEQPVQTLNKFERICKDFSMTIYNNNMKVVSVAGIKKLKVNADKVEKEIINLSNNSNKVDIQVKDLVLPTIAVKVEQPVEEAPVEVTPVAPVVEEPKVEVPEVKVEEPVVTEQPAPYEAKATEPATVNVDDYLGRNREEDIIGKKKARNEEAAKKLEVLQQRLNDINSRLEESEKKKAEKALDDEFESITISIDELNAQIQEGLSKLGEN